MNISNVGKKCIVLYVVSFLVNLFSSLIILKYAYKADCYITWGIISLFTQLGIYYAFLRFKDTLKLRRYRILFYALFIVTQVVMYKVSCYSVGYLDVTTLKRHLQLKFW